MDFRRTALLSAAAVLFALAAPQPAHAWGSFFVSKEAGADIDHRRTDAVVTRWQGRSVLSLQADYRGPRSEFALVIPIPTSDDVRVDEVETLPRELFRKIEEMSAPRMVHAEQRDPCFGAKNAKEAGDKEKKRKPALDHDQGPGKPFQPPQWQAEFTEGEFEFRSPDAPGSSALLNWLKGHNYAISDGLSERLEPLPESTRFLVAEADADELKFENGHATLSPIRVYFRQDSPRTPLLAVHESHELVLHVFAPYSRFRAANRPNAIPPTNVPVTDKTAEGFDAFYAGIFENILRKDKSDVVTEYAFRPSICRFCRKNMDRIDGSDRLTLGGDILDDPPGAHQLNPFARGGSNDGYRSPPESVNEWVWTRLHARLKPGDTVEPIELEKAEPLRGGVTQPQGEDGRDLPIGLEDDARGKNRFLTRFVFLDDYEAKIECGNPIYIIWTEEHVISALDLSAEPLAPTRLSDFIEVEEVPGLDIEPESDEE